MSKAKTAIEADVLIIGGGAIGICAAWFMAQSGRQVTLVERNLIGGGCSQGNAGLIVPSHVQPLAAPGVIRQGLKWMFRKDSPFYIKPRLDLDLFKWLLRFRASCTSKHVAASIPVLHGLSQASMKLFDLLSGEKDLDFAYRRDGLLMVYRGSKGRQGCLEEIALAREVGLDVTLLEGPSLRQLEPEVPQDAAGGLYYRGDTHLDPVRFVQSLADSLPQLGVTLLTGTEVTGFEQSQGRIQKVFTNGGTFAPKDVLLAGGAWSPQIVRDLGLKLPIQPAKGYSVTIKGANRKPLVPMILCEDKVTITPLPDALRFAGTLSLAGLDSSIDAGRVASILRAVPQYVEGFDPRQFDLTKVWSGFRPCTPDGLPYLGRSQRLENLLIATGHAMVGMTLAPITGRLISQLANHDQPHLDITALNPERFCPA